MTKNQSDVAASGLLSPSTRRTFIGRSAGAALALSGAGTLLAACGGSGSGGGEVNVLSFQSYIDPTIKKLWAEKYPDIALHGTPAGSDQELLTKLRAGGASAYDVVFCDFGYAPIYNREGLIEVMDLSEQPAASQLYPQFREDVEAFPYLTAPDKAIGFPCEWAAGAMAFSTTADFVPSAPYSWTAMWDPSIPSNKVGFETEQENLIATAALALGYPPNKVFALGQSELQEIVEYVREIKPFRIFKSDPEARNALRTEEVWVSLVPTPAFAAKINEEAGKPVTKSVVPKEGAVGFIDGPMLVKEAKNRENALKFINWFAGDPKLRQYVFEAYLAAPCSKPVVESLLKEGGKNAQLVKELNGPEPEVATTVAQAQPAKDAKAYAEAWDAILA
jgi:spermidine/putrescine-binding protein